ncbi:MAG: S-layer homology domain-containing protein [Phormidesmis sp.]
MTQSPFEPSDNPTPTSPSAASAQRDDTAATDARRPLTFDEMVALLVAFLSLGSVLFWGLSRGGMSPFGDSLASANTPLVSPRSSAQPSRRPLAFGGGEPSVDVTGEDRVAGTLEGAQPEEFPGRVRNSARRELENRAAARREANITRRPLWDDMRVGVAGAAAGITGVAVTPEAATAEPDLETPADEVIPETEPDTAVTESSTPLSAAATATPKEAIAFNDLPDDYWAKPYIDALSSRGLISGYEEGDFRPDQPVTRAQIANIVSRTFELTADKENLEFSDVRPDFWARESIGEVVKGGFMTGFPGNTFKPNDPVTRTQALTTLVTGLGIEQPTNIQAALSRYSDANAIPKWAQEKVAAATAGGIVVNYPTLEQLKPTESTTRAELSAMMYQALAQAGAVEPIDSQYVVQP